MKNPRSSKAASEIVGEIILLVIAVTSVSIIYLNVLSTPGPLDTPNVTINGKMEAGRPVFELKRGESLGPDTKILLTLAGYDKREFLLKDIGYQEWDIGKPIVLPIEDITGVQTEATIVDTQTNSIVFWGVIQKGFTIKYKGGIWHFNEPIWRGIPNEVNDSSGNNNHGIALNGTNVVTSGKTGNAGNFDGFMDVVKVNSSWTLNITNSITVEAWMKPQIRKTVAALVDIEGNFGFTPYIIHAVGNIYVMVTEDTNKIGRVSTVHISDLGEIDDLKNITFGNCSGSKNLRPIITQISDTIYLVAFVNKKDFICVQTFNISANGTIKISDYCSLNQSVNNVENRPSIQKITNNLCAIAYWSTNSIARPGILRTLDISPTGKITPKKWIMYDPQNGYEPCLARATAGNVFALTYRGASDYGFIKTYNITSTGNITYTNTTVPLETGKTTYQPCLIQVSGRVFAVAYRNNLNYGGIKTFNISSNGSIVPTGKSKVFEYSDCYNPCIAHVVDDMYVVVFSAADSTGNSLGYYDTLRLLNNGSIGLIDPRIQFEMSDSGGQTRCFNPIILRLSDYLFAISYEGFGPHPGKLITLLIGKIPRGICKGTSYLLYAKLTNTSITQIEGCINNVYVYYNMSLGADWHHFALTYDGMNIRLYINGTKVIDESYPYHRIKLTKEPLYFGRFYCGLIDEVAIYDKALTQQEILYHVQHPGSFEIIPF
jgi:hypothetical protein